MQVRGQSWAGGRQFLLPAYDVSCAETVPGEDSAPASQTMQAAGAL